VACSLPRGHARRSQIGVNHPDPTATFFCSDGLTKHVSNARIAERLHSMTSARQVCEELLQDALAGGGTDNITIVVGRAPERDSGA
jgi:serine/threonine protein phosphatase PrpC